MRLMSYEEQLTIAASLEDYHKCFFIFFEMSSISFSDEVPTAGVRFPQFGKPSMMINEVFWDALTPREKQFVICHECLHVMLDHGVRNGLSVPGATPRLVNMAQDITINEMIVNLFGFDREDIREWKKYCWIDTCFDDPGVISRNETFLYYLEKLIKNPPKDEKDGGPSIFDEHGLKPDGQFQPAGGGTETQTEKENKQDAANTIAAEMTAEELENILKSLPEAGEAGSMSGMLESLIAVKGKRVHLKFKHLIRKLKKTSLKEVPIDVESFTKDDRRFNDVLSRGDILLPGKAEISKLSADRLLTLVFMDVSGSCLQFLKTFNQVFRAFDEERKIFETRLFIFDTTVTEVKPGDRARIGGGTKFDIIEKKCIALEEEYKRYPDCVVVITDGDGTPVDPKAPTKWIWLLTPKDSTKKYIPTKSRTFSIDQVTF